MLPSPAELIIMLSKLFLILDLYRDKLSEADLRWCCVGSEESGIWHLYREPHNGAKQGGWENRADQQGHLEQVCFNV